MKHTMSMYASKDNMIEAMQAEIDELEAELEELRKDHELLQFCIDYDTFPVKDQSGAYIMSKNNEFFSVSEYSRKSIELAFEYAKYKTEKVMRGKK